MRVRAEVGFCLEQTREDVARVLLAQDPLRHGVQDVGFLPEVSLQELRVLFERRPERPENLGVSSHVAIHQANKLAQQPLALLYASQAAIYHRYGYGIVSSRNSYTLDPRYLAFVHSNAPFNKRGNLRELEENEFDILKDVYR